MPKLAPQKLPNVKKNECDAAVPNTAAAVHGKPNERVKQRLKTVITSPANGIDTNTGLRVMPMTVATAPPQPSGPPLQISGTTLISMKGNRNDCVMSRDIHNSICLRYLLAVMSYMQEVQQYVVNIALRPHQSRLNQRQSKQHPFQLHSLSETFSLANSPKSQR